jgi:hypothetical protein
MEEKKQPTTFEEKIKMIKDKHIHTEEQAPDADPRKTHQILQKLYTNPKFKDVVTIIQPELVDNSKQKEKLSQIDLMINKFIKDFKNRNKENPQKKQSKPVKEQLKELRNGFLSVRNTYDSKYYKRENNIKLNTFLNKPKPDPFAKISKNYFKTKLFK